MKKLLLCSALLLIFVCPGQAIGRKKDIPLAPLPTAITQAKKAYLLNGQTTSAGLTKNGNELAFDALYADMKGWGKYQLVGSPSEADIVIELQYRPHLTESGGVGVYNPYSKTITTSQSEAGGADFALVFYQASTKEQLWTVSDACGSARRVKNQQKEVEKSVGRLVEDLKSRGQPGT